LLPASTQRNGHTTEPEAEIGVRHVARRHRSEDIGSGVMFADCAADDGMIALLTQNRFAGVMIDAANKE
jgi:hypothetical protein